MTAFRFVMLVLQIVSRTITYMEKQGILKDEQRRELLRQLQLSADAVIIKEKNIAAAAATKGEALDTALTNDFRD